MEGNYVVALDVGTTTVRCHVLDQSTATIGTASHEVEHLYPEVGRDEIKPDELWTKVVGVLRDAIKVAGVSPNQVACIGISTQRSSFITWHKDTGKPFHNFITWKDLRADNLVRQWNESFRMKGLRTGAHCLYTVSRSKRFLAGSVIKLMNSQVTLRLVWALENIPTLKQAVNDCKVMFGTVDTWILYKLTGGRLHVTDVSNASATGFYDPFTMQWGNWALKMFHIPADMLPEVWDTAADFGSTTSEVFGIPVPIHSLVADQAASLFGSCCFEEGDIKVTMGTGTFLNVNTGSKPCASVEGLYPQVAWRIGKEIVFSMEGASHDTGTLIKWAQEVGLVSNPQESTQAANSVEDSNGLCFIPAFSGLQECFQRQSSSSSAAFQTQVSKFKQLICEAPVNNYQAAAGFIGIKPTTSRHHMMRAILESIVFRIIQLYQALQREVKYRYSNIRVDGGVSKNDFIDQLLADLTGLKVERSKSSEMSILGAGFLAGLHAGIWQNKNKLKDLRQVDQTFEPRKEVCEKYSSVLSLWSQALERFSDWYEA